MAQDSMVRLFSVDGRQFRVLFSDSPSATVLADLLQTGPSASIPHYVRPVTAAGHAYRMPQQYSESDFAELLGLDTQPDNLISTDRALGLLIELYSTIDKLRLEVVSAPVTRRYKLGFRQCNFIKADRHEIVPGAIDIDGLVREDCINATILHLLARHPFLRSVVDREAAEYCFVEHAPPTRFDVSLIDLSAHAPSIQAALLDRLRYECCTAMIVSSWFNRPLFHFIACRLNLRQCRVIVIFDHNIADLEAVHIFEREFITTYSALSEQAAGATLIETEGPSAEILSNRPTYQQYLESLNQAEESGLGEAVKEWPEFVEYRSAVEAFRSKFGGPDRPADSRLPFGSPVWLTFELRDLASSSRLRDALTFALWLFLRVCFESLGLEVIPMQVANRARHFGGRDYTSVIGDFHLRLPIAFSRATSSTPESCLRHLVAVRSKFLDAGVNIEALSERGEVFRRWDVADLNFIGEVAEDLERIVYDQLSSWQQRSGNRLYRCNAYLCGDHVGLIFPDGVASVESLESIDGVHLVNR